MTKCELNATLMRLIKPTFNWPSDDPLKYLGDKTGGTKFKLQPVSLGYVEPTIKALNNSKSPGADRIPVKILKDAVKLVSKPLTLIYNASLGGGTFPQIWKLARR